MKKCIISFLFLILISVLTFSMSLSDILNVYGYEAQIKEIGDTLWINLETKNSNYKLYEFLTASIKALKFYNEQVKRIENNYKTVIITVNGKGLKFNKKVLNKAANILDIDKKLTFLLKNGEKYGR